MTSAFLDLFKKDELGNPIWIGAVRDISTARSRLLELVTLFPGEYFVFDSRSCRIVETIGQDNSRVDTWELC